MQNFFKILGLRKYDEIRQLDPASECFNMNSANIWEILHQLPNFFIDITIQAISVKFRDIITRVLHEELACTPQFRFTNKNETYIETINDFKDLSGNTVGICNLVLDNLYKDFRPHHMVLKDLETNTVIGISFSTEKPNDYNAVLSINGVIYYSLIYIPPKID